MKLTTIALLAAFTFSVLIVTYTPSEAVICAKNQKWSSKKKQCVPR